MAQYVDVLAKWLAEKSGRCDLALGCEVNPEMCCGTEAGSYLRLIDYCIRLKDLLGPVTRVKKKKKAGWRRGAGGATPRSAVR